MSTIYILTAGEYSDYHIVAAFSTKELAEEAQKFCPDSVIGEYELDSIKIPEHPPGHLPWSVTIQMRGDYVSVIPMNILEYPLLPPTIYYLYGIGYYKATCWAKDKEHAKKIAIDKYYQWKHENQNECN